MSLKIALPVETLSQKLNCSLTRMFVFELVFISLSIDPLQGQRPHGYRNSQVP